MPKVKKSSARRVAVHPYKKESGHNVKTSVEVKKDIIKTDNSTDKIESESGVLSSQQLSRGQKKRQAKREQFLRKEKLIFSSLQLKEDTEQRRRIDGLDAIKNALMGTCVEAWKGVTSEGRHTPRITNNRAKKSVVENEVERMKLVLQHPAYQNDALATLQEHLRNTLVDDRKLQEEVSKERAKNEMNERTLKRKRARKKYKPRRIG
jgi:hypothetical protein